ncbi:hypothetical protein QTP88_028052 [Uroleucon formosanum]
MACVLTRNKLKCLIFGDAKELSNNVLPTFEDVILCNCEKSRKVPTIEQVFIIEQTTTRKMVMTSIDISITTKLQKKIIRKETDAKRIEKKISTEIDDSDENFIAVSTSSSIKNSQMRLKLPALAMAYDRTGISDRSAATIASAILKDVEKGKKRIDLQKVKNKKLLELYFDGRKDKTMVNHKEGTKYYRQIITEERISLIQEPESKYISHAKPTNGSALQIKNSIINFLETNNIVTSDIVAIGCDGTVVNTGFRTKVIWQIEEHLKKPLQWFICQLHANELPLRHLFQHLDGKTTGPNGFSDSIGKQLEICHKLPVVEFVRIESNLPYLKNEVDLSTDQKYLFEMCLSISNGNCSIDLSRRNPGKQTHSRWLTTANRILRLYISIKSPTENLKILAEFLLKV